MSDVPVSETGWDGFVQQRYDFNFLPVQDGLRGYLWAFPCLIDQVPHVNIGIYSLGANSLSHAALQDRLSEEIDAFSTATEFGKTRRLRAFPIYGYASEQPLAAPRVVLAGDAAGAEPLMGEGISLRLNTGAFAAQAVRDALRTKIFHLTRIRGVSLGRGWARSWRGCLLQPSFSMDRRPASGLRLRLGVGGSNPSV